MFRIGDFSRLSQVSIKALRFYDEVGLLKPTFVDRATGYRYYAANLLSRLNRILVFKELGFTLDEIALLLHEGMPVEQVREALHCKREDLSRRITREQARLAQVEAWLTQIEREGRSPNYEIALRQVAPQLVASMRDNVDSYDDAAGLFDELNRHLKSHNAHGQQAAIWHTCAGQAEHIDCEALVFLDRPVPENKRIAVYELPSSVNACLLHHGSDDTITDAYVAARSWIETNGYTIAGPLRELYWQGGVAQGDGPGVTEIRYPIIKSQSLASGSRQFLNN
jgi:DNA-binding transcriptional MerR regulator